MRTTARRVLVALVAVWMAGACAAGSDVEIADTDRVRPDTTDVPETTDEPADTTDEPADTTEPSDTTFPPVTDPDSTPPDTALDDTLPPDDPNSSTTVVESFDFAATYPLGTEAPVGDVGLKVVEYIPDATALAENAYLEVPEGWQAVAVRAALANYGAEPALYFYPELLLVRPDGTAFPQQYCGGPAWAADIAGLSLLPGGRGEGTTCFIVPIDAVTDVVFTANDYFEPAVPFALQPDQGTKSAPALPALPPPPAPGSSPPGSWKSPIPLGTPGSIEDYSVAVSAFQENAPTPEYSGEPPEGWHYVAVDLDVTFNGTDVAEAGFVELSMVGDGGRLVGEDFNCAFDDEDSPYEPEIGVAQHWSRCFAVPDTELPSVELVFSAGFDEALLFLAVR